MTSDLRIVSDLQEADFQTWKHHPVTKVYRQYLAHFAAALERDHIARWKAGEADERTEAEAAGRIKTLEELAGLEFEHIAEFYQEPEANQEPDETETLRDPSGEV